MDPLLAKVIQGDRQAYAKLIAQYQGTVWSILSVLLYDRPTTERLAQRVFIDAYLRLDKLDATKHTFKEFVRTIARYHVREQLRIASEKSDRIDAYRDHLAKHFASDTAASDYQKKIADRFRQASTQLPPAAATILQMRYHQSQDLAAISKATSRPITSVRQNLHQALTALAGRMIHAEASK